MASNINDVDWVKSSFMVPSYRMPHGTPASYYTSAQEKFTDTTPGGSFAINPPPQFTKTADLRVSGVAPGGSSKGMGRKYSEMIDDNSQVVYLRFGVPQFNSMISFFGGMYDGYAGILSRTGREPDWFYSIGKATGFVVSAPIQPLLLAGKIYKFLAQQPTSKYYFMKPAMPLYWNTVNSIANHIAVNMGIVPRVLTSSANAETQNRTDAGDDKNGDPIKDRGNYNIGDVVTDAEYSKEDIRKFHTLLPTIYRPNGGIDVYALATRAQRLANQRREAVVKAAESADNYGDVTRAMAEASRSQLSKKSPNFGDGSLDAYVNAWQSQSFLSKVSPGEKDKFEAADNATKVGGEDGWWSKASDFFQSELNDGGQFVGIRVNHVGEASESFSNQSGESKIAEMLNGTASGARSMRFSFADGNLTGMIGKVVESGRQLIEGALDGIGISGIGSLLMGTSFADIPEEWKDSTSELSSTSYTIELRSPYGNKMSRFTNLMVPLSMILAGTLPKSVGKHSYDSPFLCQIFDKGRAQVRLGIIDSLSITRGTGNIGWTQSHEPLGIDITFSIKDLSSVMHMPLSNSPGIFDEDNLFTDYMAVLGSLSLTDQIYASNRLRLSLTRKLTNWKSMNSPARWGMLAANSLPGEAIRAFARATDRD